MEQDLEKRNQLDIRGKSGTSNQIILEESNHEQITTVHH